MSGRLLEKLGKIADRFDEIEQQLGDPDVIASPEYRELAREHARLGKLVRPYRELREAQDQVAQAREMLDEPDMREMAGAEIEAQEARVEQLTEEIKARLVQADPLAERPALLEIRAGAGGDEACLFAGDLLRMYQLYCQRVGWSCETMSSMPAEVGGIKEAVLEIKGEGAYGLLRFEAGGHRVQRVPATESQGRIHTSAATVAVMPEAEDVDVQIDPDDLHIDTYRAGGAGGQHVNKTESAVRITHEPSGVVVTCQDEKSQLANRDRAMKMLRARVFEIERERQAAERAAARKEQVGSGDRSDRIRTYNFPQNRITDHRVNVSLHSLDQYMEGNVDELQRAMIDAEKERVLEEWES